MEVLDLIKASDRAQQRTSASHGTADSRRDTRLPLATHPLCAPPLQLGLYGFRRLPVIANIQAVRIFLRLLETIRDDDGLGACGCGSLAASPR
jgi:hypothetical protein